MKKFSVLIIFHFVPLPHRLIKELAPQVLKSRVNKPVIKNIVCGLKTRLKISTTPPKSCGSFSTPRCIQNMVGVCGGYTNRSHRLVAGSFAPFVFQFRSWSFLSWSACAPLLKKVSSGSCYLTHPSWFDVYMVVAGTWRAGKRRFVLPNSGSHKLPRPRSSEAFLE